MINMLNKQVTQDDINNKLIFINCEENKTFYLPTQIFEYDKRLNSEELGLLISSMLMSCGSKPQDLTIDNYKKIHPSDSRITIIKCVNKMLKYKYFIEIEHDKYKLNNEKILLLEYSKLSNNEKEMLSLE